MNKIIAVMKNALNFPQSSVQIKMTHITHLIKKRGQTRIKCKKNEVNTLLTTAGT